MVSLSTVVSAGFDVSIFCCVEGFPTVVAVSPSAGNGVSVTVTLFSVVIFSVVGLIVDCSTTLVVSNSFTVVCSS